MELLKKERWNNLVLVATAGRLPTNLTSAFINIVGYLTYQTGFIGYLCPEKKSFHSVCNVTEGIKYVLLLTTLTLRKERGCTYPKFLPVR